jgi:ribosomal protein S18 acetylase RimI-like enzyme
LVNPLDHPVWHALTSTQGALAQGGALARRYPPDIAPFADMADMSPESFAALGALMAPSDYVVLFTPEAVSPPAAFKVLLARTGEQMIGTPADAPGTAEIVRLGAADVPGNFLGIRAGGQLVAMAGERMKPGNHTEITAVCVHPDHRGRGHAQALLGAAARGIVARGETPFLHVFSDNDGAIALYRRQGMEIRRRLYVTVLGKAA